jgi:sulfatase modifying factor 1
MRKNPYLKDEQEFRPLLMRGALRNDFLITSLQMKQEIERLSSTTKETYTLNGISFDMVRSPSLNTKGIMFPTTNVEMCTTECTQGLFESVMGFNYARFRDKTDSAQRPIENVSWFDCISFCNKLSEMLGYAPYYDVANITFGDKYSPKRIERAEVTIIGGNGFRLPTAEEWITFAKAGTNNTWAGTNNEKEVGKYAWYRDNAFLQTRPVATKKPNEWGMYDMTGNVSEWVWDSISGTQITRVCCGGNFSDSSGVVRSVARDGGHPSIYVATLGFRFARTIE